MAKKEALGKDRFDRRIIYTNARMSEKDFAAVKPAARLAGENPGYVRVAFAQRLTDQLENRLLTEVAEETDIAQGSLSDYRSGKTEARITALARLAGYFDVSTDYLLGMTHTATRDQSERKWREKVGLSDKAIETLEKGKSDSERPLYSEIVSFLLESGTLDNLVKLLEKSLILREQYRVLFEENDGQRENVLETQEYQFNKQLASLYENVMEKLSSQLSASISILAEERFFDFVDGALDTKEKMEQIIDAALSDPAKLDEYNRRHQTFE